MATAQFENIYHSLGPAPGKLRIAPSGLGWKSSDEKEAVVTVPGSDIKWISWIRVARNYQMRIGTHKQRTTFDGFLREDHERLSNLCKQYYNITIETKDTSVRGWNWGVAEVQADDLAFLVAGKPAFTIPLNQVSNTSIQKAEVALEFSSALPTPPSNAEEDAVARKKRLRAQPDEISEMRLYIPGSARGMKKKGDKAKAKAEGAKQESDDEEESEEEEERPVAGPSSAATKEDEDDKKKGVQTKYDRMFARKSQTILSDHYTKLIEHDDDDAKDAPEGELLGGAADGGDEDDFITIKRRDHDLDESALPSSSFLSKRKLKMGQSKKAMLSTKGNPSKLVFDDEGAGHAIYELGDEEDFAALGDAEDLRKQFVRDEAERLGRQDVLDKERQREKRREKKRKRKDMEREARGEGDDAPDFAGPDGEIIHPDFSDIDLPSASEDDAPQEKAARAPVHKKQRRARFGDVDGEGEARPQRPKVDLEALALQALARR